MWMMNREREHNEQAAIISLSLSVEAEEDEEEKRRRMIFYYFLIRALATWQANLSRSVRHQQSGRALPYATGGIIRIIRIVVDTHSAHKEKTIS